jgi:pyruvate/2-oxoglutarate dehydrogenase complex dihydrolipoamide acyltransferase (E2) component
VRERPGIEDGKLVIRPILKLGVTLDHRVMDGYKGGQLSAELKLMFQDPEKIPVSYGAEVEKPIEPHR